jgi:hypothetical protein
MVMKLSFTAVRSLPFLAIVNIIIISIIGSSSNSSSSGSSSDIFLDKNII